MPYGIRPMLAKTQIQELNDDQQTTVAEVELCLARKRQKLLRQARGYSPLFLGITLLSPIASLFCLIAFRAAWLPMLVVAAIFAFVIQVQINFYMNRRLDALLELLYVETKV